MYVKTSKKDSYLTEKPHSLSERLVKLPKHKWFKTSNDVELANKLDAIQIAWRVRYTDRSHTTHTGFLHGAFIDQYAKSEPKDYVKQEEYLFVGE